jgi:tetratricopeptide (TPR) repeat protein
MRALNRRELLGCCLVLAATLGVAGAKDHPVETAGIIVRAEAAGCRVELDAIAKGTTDEKGKLILTGVNPGDHYIHVTCPGKVEQAYFVSPKRGDEIRIEPRSDDTSSTLSDPAILAENKAKLQQLVQKAIQLRNQAQLDDAVTALRQAMALDPENSDLHREMGITFLLAKEWSRARIEMIEAIRHDQSDADAHNGLGYALEKLGDLDGALKEYRIATQLEPDDASYSTHYIETQVKIQARQDAKK